MQTAAYVAAAGATILRGGAYKPRSSPYSFQGMGEAGLALLAEARRRFGLAIVTEALDEASAERVAAVADIVQIGARNMQNFELLKKIGRLGKPVLLKRARAPRSRSGSWLRSTSSTRATPTSSCASAASEASTARRATSSTPLPSRSLGP